MEGISLDGENVLPIQGKFKCNDLEDSTLLILFLYEASCKNDINIFAHKIDGEFNHPDGRS